MRDLRVALEREGLVVARGTRTSAFAGSATVRLAFRRPARAGRLSIVATGRRAGCAAKRTARRAVSLDRHDLPVALGVAGGDVRDGRFAVTVRRTAARAVTDLRVRVLDARGATVAEHARDAPVGAPLRIEFAPPGRLAAGRYSVLATGSPGHDRPRATSAAAIDLRADPAPPAGPSGGAARPPGPGPGAVVQQVAVSWGAGAGRGLAPPASLPASARARSCAGPTCSGSASSPPTARATPR